MSDFVEIDGSVLEGGGQILRIAISLSAICNIPVRIKNIRANRSKPGLMAQHLKGLELVRDISNAKVEGAFFGSTEIEFTPYKLKGGSFKAEIDTAGSISLLLQIALPCCIFATTDTTLKLKGGTNAEMAPQIDFMTEVVRPNLERFGATFDFELLRRGYFPKGGGEVIIRISPVESLNPINLVEQGKVKTIYGWSFTAGSLPVHIANTMADSAVKEIKRSLDQYLNPSIERYKESPQIAFGNCSGIILVGETTSGCIIGGSSLGKRNIPPDESGIMAANEIIHTYKDGACVDQYTQDQLIIFMAIADGISKIKVGKITLHTETAIYVVEQMTKAKFKIENFGSSSYITCDGIGVRRHI